MTWEKRHPVMAKLSTSKLCNWTALLVTLTFIPNVYPHLSLLNSSSCNCSNEEFVFEFLEPQSSYGGGTQPSPIPALSDACRAILHVFSQSVANFTSCLVMHARPLTFCQKCIEEFQIVQHWYQNISVPSEDKCDSELLNRDHLMVVQSILHDVKFYWTTAQCENCYSHENTLSSEPRLCNDTLTFFETLSKVTQCINETNIDDLNVKNASMVCEKCQGVYLKLNEYYEEMNTKYNNRLCMDVVDAMNITRHLWSSTYMCNYLQVGQLAVLLSTMGFFFLPLTFYCGNRYVAIAKDTKLVPQKRMSFVQTSYSSTTVQR